MDALNPLIEQLTKMIKDGYNLGKRELPDVGRQIIAYESYINTWRLRCVAPIAICSASFECFILYKTWQHWDGASFMASLYVLCFMLIFMGLSGEYYSNLVKMKIAPKLFLLDALKSYWRD